MGQITEVEQQEIEKKGKKLYPFNFNGMDNNTQEIRREFWINGAIAMAEKKNAEIIELKTKLEEKDKEIERLKYDLDPSVKVLVETCKKQNHELAQLKKIQIWFYKKQFGFETDESAQSNIDSDYAEWCKQNLK